MATEDQANNPDQGEGEPDGKDDDASRDWKQEAFESRKRRDNALKRAQNAEAKIRSYEERLAEQQREIDEIRESYEGKKPANDASEAEELKRQLQAVKEKARIKEQELLSELNKVQGERKEFTIREAVIKAASESVINPEAFYKLTRDQYNVEENEKGQAQIVSRSGSSLTEFIQEALDDPEYSWMAKKQRRNGMGVNQTEATVTTDKKIDFERMMATGGLTKEAFEKNPEMARQFLANARLKT